MRSILSNALRLCRWWKSISLCGAQIWEKSFIAKDRINLDAPDATLIHVAPNEAGPHQRKLKREKLQRKRTPRGPCERRWRATGWLSSVKGDGKRAYIDDISDGENSELVSMDGGYAPPSPEEKIGIVCGTRRWVQHGRPTTWCIVRRNRIKSVVTKNVVKLKLLR